MDRDQLKFALVQVLENYRRCGISRVERGAADSLSSAVIDRIAASALDTTALSPASRRRDPGPLSPESAPQGSTPAAAPMAPTSSEQPLSPPSISQPSTSPTSHTTAATAVTSTPGSAPTLTAGGSDWSLPILEMADRRVRFSELQGQVIDCTQCAGIVSYRQQTVFGAGPLNPTVCFMGEAPGADEDRTGEPFVGKAGQLLSKIIVAMKLQREEVYILNALKCRPPQNRTPVPEEITNCRHFVSSQLNILQPKYIVCLGSVAVQSLLQSTLPIGRLRGRFHEYRGAKLVVTYHPSYLLRNESAKRLVWEDMQMLMREMGLK